MGNFFVVIGTLTLQETALVGGGPVAFPLPVQDNGPGLPDAPPATGHRAGGPGGPG